MNGGEPRVYLASADWMGAPASGASRSRAGARAQAGERVIDEGLKPYLADTMEAWTLGADDATPAAAVRKGGSCAQHVLLPTRDRRRQGQMTDIVLCATPTPSPAARPASRADAQGAEAGRRMARWLHDRLPPTAVI